MSGLWEDIQNKLLQIKTEHNNQAKRAIKTQVPKQQIVRTEIAENLIKLFNEFVQLVNSYWLRFTPEHKAWIQKAFDQLRDRTIQAFAKLDFNYLVPLVPTERINKSVTQIIDIDLDGNNETDELPLNNVTLEDTMPLSLTEFFTLADKLLPKSFNGDAPELVSFVDALELLKANSEGHNENALKFVKTRLTGKARLAVTADVADLDGVITVLKKRCQCEKSHVVEAKLANIKQNGKDATAFTNQVNDLAANLLSMYISEGVRADTAENFVKNRALKTLIGNAKSDRTRVVMEAGNFDSLQDAITKFITVETDAPQASNIFYANSFRGNFRGTYNGHRGYSQHNNRGAYNRRGRYIRRNMNQSQGRVDFRPHNTYHNNRGRGRNFGNRAENIRTYQSENSQHPHLQQGGGTINKLLQISIILFKFFFLKINAVGATSSFLVDTGADISVIKISKISQNYPKYPKKCTIHGVTASTIQSTFAITTNIFLDVDNRVEHEVEHEFHIVSDDFPIPADGILGRDFLTRYKCIIDYDEWSLSVKLEYPNKSLRLPMQGGPEKDCLVFPAWSEVTREVTLNSSFQNAFIPGQRVAEGVYTQKTIVSGSKVLITFINTNLHEVTIKNLRLEAEDLNNYDIYTLKNKNGDRNSELLGLLNSNVPSFVAKDLTKLCQEYSDIFALKSDKLLTCNNFYKQSLRTLDNQPVYVKNYRTPQAQKAEINRQVEKLLESDVIEPSVSSYNSPVLLVPKKSLNGEKRWRMVVDFRQVNKKLIADRFPLPRIEDILDQLGRAKWFSVLDLMSGFHQILLEEDSRDITSFTVDAGTFRFKRLPFGLSVSPNSFQRMMHIAFASLSPERAFMYMDDLIVIGCSEKHHLKNLQSVFEVCRKFCLKLNPEKCQFFRKDVTYLGHHITDRGILPDKSKFDIIKNYPRPQNPDTTKRFVAFCNYYRRFIQNFASLTYCLNKLTRKNAIFNWTTDCENSFQNLKNALMQPPILQYPRFDKPFVITTDAAKFACGAVLSQVKDGIDLPIAYASRAFTKGELNKSTIEKELAAIHWAILHFQPYVYGRKFTIRSDHKPLVYLFSMKNPSSKLTRMRLDLEEFDFHIEYVKGNDNVVADALSRIDVEQLKEIQSSQTQILAVQTRSRLRKNNTVVSENTEQNVEGNLTENFPKIYEVIENFEASHLPKLIFKLDTPYPKMQIIMNNNKKRARVNINIDSCITTEILALEQVISRLEKVAGEQGINKLQLELNSQIFNYVPLSNFKIVANDTLHNLQIVLTKPIQKVFDATEKQALITRFHRDPILGGHCGQKRMLSKLRSYFFWNSMRKDVVKFIKACHECQVNKAKPKNVEPLCITPSPLKAFDIVIIDTIGPFPKTSSGNVYAVTLECELTKYVIMQPCQIKKQKH
uniref:RNA-directed DNA polymerase n=2 Tax=Photinus pyralis TaxID=7054 RepID=A0A1Y1L2Y9_PHOPY